jgi:hypothetical protein
VVGAVPVTILRSIRSAEHFVAGHDRRTPPAQAAAILRNAGSPEVWVKERMQALNIDEHVNAAAGTSREPQTLSGGFKEDHP